MPTDDADVPSNLAELRTRVGHLETQTEQLRNALAENTAATRRVESNTSELIDMFVSWKGAFKVFDQIGKLAKPLGAIFLLGSAVIGFWQAIKTGLLR